MGCQTSKVVGLAQKTAPTTGNNESIPPLECNPNKDLEKSDKLPQLTSGSNTPIVTPHTADTYRRIQSLTPSVRVYQIRKQGSDCSDPIRQAAHHGIPQLETAAPKQPLDKKAQHPVGNICGYKPLDLLFQPIPEVNDESKIQSEQELREEDKPSRRSRTRTVKAKQSLSGSREPLGRSQSLLAKPMLHSRRVSATSQGPASTAHLVSDRRGVGGVIISLPEPTPQAGEVSPKAKKQKRFSRRKHTAQLDLQPGSPAKKSGFAPKKCGIKSTRLLSGDLHAYSEERVGFMARSQCSTGKRPENFCFEAHKPREPSMFSPEAKRNKFVFLQSVGEARPPLKLSSKPSPSAMLQEAAICSSGKASSRSSRQRSTLMHRSPEASACPSLGNMQSADQASTSTVRIRSHRIVGSVRPLLGRFLPGEGGLDAVDRPAGHSRATSQKRESIEAHHLMSIHSPQCNDDAASRLMSDGKVSSRVASAAKSLQRIACGPATFLSSRQVMLERGAVKRETKQIKAFQAKLNPLVIEKKPSDTEIQLQRLPMQPRTYSYRRNLLDKNQA